jgi:hypothetical protein
MDTLLFCVQIVTQSEGHVQIKSDFKNRKSLGDFIMVWSWTLKNERPKRNKALAGIISIAIALLTIGYQSFRAALMNPVDSLKSE